MDEVIVAVRVPGLTEMEWKIFVALVKSEGRDVKDVIGGMIRDYVKKYLRENKDKIKDVLG